MEGENVNTEKDASEQRKNSVNLHFLYVKLHISFEIKKKLRLDILVMPIKIKFNI